MSEPTDNPLPAADPAPAPGLREADKDAIREAYAQLREGLPGYRVRASQGRMIAAVSRAFSRPGGAAVVEAPTGTGKSMAYLIPGLVLAQARKKQLIIATATVALQQQLVRHDIPQFLAATGLDAEVVLAKGRQRYACVRNLHELSQGDDGPQEGLALGESAAVAAWPRRPLPGEAEDVAELLQAINTRHWDGDIDDPPLPIHDETRALITTSAGGCANRRCPWITACPFVLARNRLRDARIIVANQDLVLADLMLAGKADEDSTGGVLLPAPADSLYVFDEAHHLAAKAIDRGSAEVYLADARRRIARLGQQVAMAYSLVDKDRIARLEVDGVEHLCASYAEELEAIESAISSAWLPAHDEDQPQWRAPLGELPDDWRALAGSLRESSSALVRWLIAAIKAVVDAADLPGGQHEVLVREFGLARERIERQHALWWLWSTDDAEGQPPTARWLGLARDGGLICHASAVSAAAILRRVLWQQAGGVVLTSATLSAGGDFRAIASQVGLPAEAETLSLPSPFDLPRQARLEVPMMRALPNDNDAHVAEVVDWLLAGLDWDRGNLVLFTSRRKLLAALDRLPADRRAQVRAQGKQSKPVLLAAHRAAIEAGEGSTLFGLASFGEGVDLPGRLCETVVITQLPFSVPTDPVDATYAEWLEAHGRNAFVEVSVPNATRTLIQYCGRLIRNEDDIGRIVILDRRIVSKRYGAGMLRALPPFQRVLERG